MLPRRYALCSLVVLAVFIIGCSNASKPPAPTAPTQGSASSSSASIDLNTATVPGTVGAGSDKPVVGTVGQSSGACPDLTFVLAGVTIHLSSTTRFESGACSDVKDGVRAGAIGTKNADGSINAVRVKIAPALPPLTHVEGTISGLGGTCPALTFTLSGTTVHTTDKTRFEGGTCADVKEGGRAGAAGPKDAGGAITAEHVKIVPPPPPHAAGAVTALGGTCPALTFTLSGTIVHTTDKTVFEGGTCADVKEGARAGAVGPKAADGSITADRVKIAPPPLPTAGGTVSSTSGACPALTFVLSSATTTGTAATTTVRVGDTTRFEGGTCADITVGARVGATGPKAADGAIEARMVKIARPK